MNLKNVMVTAGISEKDYKGVLELENKALVAEIESLRAQLSYSGKVIEILKDKIDTKDKHRGIKGIMCVKKLDDTTPEILSKYIKEGYLLDFEGCRSKKESIEILFSYWGRIGKDCKFGKLKTLRDIVYAVTLE